MNIKREIYVVQNDGTVVLVGITRIRRNALQAYYIIRFQ